MPGALLRVDATIGPEPLDQLLQAYLAKRDDLVRFFAIRLKSRAAAEDLIQDLYVRLSGLAVAEEIDNPSAYLYRLASNLMLDRLRHDRRTLARDSAWRQTRTQGVGEDVADEASAEQTVWARQRLKQTAAAIAGLPPRTRRAFELHKLGGLSQEETAKTLGVSRKTIEKQISAALKHLLAKLAESEG
jgi:RNA polymerase sigma factor (sigma-70 family)